MEDELHRLTLLCFYLWKMLTKFEKKIADFIKSNGLFGSGDKVLLAVSGGADSTALMYAMCALNGEDVLNAELVCAHINHQLRGAEADLDEDFVTKAAAKLNLPTTAKRLDVRGFARRNKLSIETAARRLRIESLLDIARATNCGCIATAHQKNDNAETILQRLLRGTGFRGLGGIWPMRAFAGGIRFVRPLFCVSRDEILQYLNERNLKWRVDHTNADCTYRRNYIRHRLLPALQQDCDGCIVEQLSELAESVRKFYSLVCSRVEKLWPELAEAGDGRVVLSLSSFLPEPPAVKVELVRRSLTTVGSGERGLMQRHYEWILRLSEQNVGGKKIELPGGFVVRREYGKLTFVQPKKNFELEKQISRSTKIEVPGKTRFGDYLIEATVFEAGESKSMDERRKTRDESNVERFDLDKVKLPLIIRSRHDGDRFWPLGLAGRKKVGKFLTAARVPHETRRKLLIIADTEKIIWVWPIRISEQARITTKTRKILQLQITGAGPSR